jgi:predicted phosphoadenosine phosphosulfate sulfurtransferase
MTRIYKTKNVLTAAQDRMRWLFDKYDNISVSISGGKDSSVLFDFAHKEAVRRNRIIDVVFIDQEAEYANTIDIIRHIASHSNIRMKWYQLPFLMTNSVSYEQDYLHCWDGGQIRALEKNSIKDIGIGNNLTWEKLLPKLEQLHNEPTAQLIGLRSNESLNRYRAVTKNPAVSGVNWSSKTTNENLINFYPIYDWGFDDIWRYMHDFQVKYNRIYDFQFAKNYHKDEMRVSCLIHERSFHCLADLPQFEPETYEWLCRRVHGVATAMRYSKEKTMYSNEKLPSHYKSWKEFRDFLLQSHPKQRQKERFEKRFTLQPQNEDVYKQQVGQLLINDFENITDVKTDQEEKRKIQKQKYIDIL